MEYKKTVNRTTGLTSDKMTFIFRNKDKSLRDMTGYLAFCQFRKGSQTGGIGLDLSIGNGMTWENITEGRLVIDLIEELNLKPDTYYFDIKVSKTGTRKDKAFKGIMEVEPIGTQTP